MSELKPCPFCAHEAQVTKGAGPFWDRVQVECSACRISTFWLDEDVARQLWNRRAALASNDAQADGGKSEAVAYCRRDTVLNWQGQLMNAAWMFPSPQGLKDPMPLYAAPQVECAPRDAITELERIAYELRAYNPAADEYKGEHICKVWAREIDGVIEQAKERQ